MYIVTERTEVLDFRRGRLRADPYSRIRKVRDTWNKLLSWEISDANTKQSTDTHNRQDDTSIDMVQQEESSMDLQCDDGLTETDAPEVQETPDEQVHTGERDEDIQFIQVALS